MDRLIVDFESYYDAKTYSLSKMTPVEYICDSRFEVIGASVRVDRGAPAAKWMDWSNPPDALPNGQPVFTRRARWVPADKLATLFGKIDWSKTAMVSHNVGFDGAVLAWRYGHVPALYIDTLGMCRASLHAHTGRSSLEKASAFLKLPAKNTTTITNASGWRLRDFMQPHHAHIFKAYQAYCEHDSDLCAAIYNLLAWRFSGRDGVGTSHAGEEFILMDMVARMAIQPQFVVNQSVLVAHHKKVVSDKNRLTETLVQKGLIAPPTETASGKRGYTDLQSNERFAEVLRKLGVEPPTKVSLKTGKESYAFSKTDQEFTDLLEDPDPLVQAAVAARLGVKSTIEETRTQRFIDIGNTCWPHQAEAAMLPAALPARPAVPGVRLFPPRMPFPLKYSGAHTHRLSGDWKLNLQNLGRKSELRRALETMPGYVVVSADASQIEARVVVWLAKCWALVEAFRNGEDVYSTFATSVFGYPVNKNDHPMERFVGKTGVLGLGFGMGWAKFIITCWNQSQRKTVIDEELAKRTVSTYRTDYQEVPAFWKLMDVVIHALSQREERDFGVFQTGSDQTLILPNGMRLFYRNMRREMVPDIATPSMFKSQWLFDYGSEVNYTFGGKMTENLVQALARIITMSAAVRIRKLAKSSGVVRVLAGQIHDQLIYVAPKEEAPDLKTLLITEMSRSLDWYHDLPLAAEGEVGPNLLEAK